MRGGLATNGGRSSSTEIRSDTGESRCTQTPSIDRGRGDGGFSFIEVLISVILLGTITVAVLVGLSTTIIGADRHRDLATGSTALIDGLEFAKAQSWDTCAGAPTSYAAADITRGGLTWSYTVSVVSSTDGTYGGSCTDSHPLRKVTVTATASDGKTAVSGDVVKRNG